MAGTLPGAPQGSTVPGILLRVAEKEAPVRCVQCRHEYDLPAQGEEIACPQCNCPSWVSTRISDEPLVPAPEPA
jgi:DNA-directed RNA polymerase subunit RPC12/RpoP